MANAGDIQARATLDNTEFLGKIAEMAQKTQSSTQNIADQIGNLGKAWAAWETALGSFKFAGAMADFASETINAAGTLLKLHAGFVGVAGASEETEQAFQKISDLEMHSVFDFEDVLGPAAKNMMLLGVSSTQTTSTMAALVDAAAGLKQGPEWITEVSGALGKMSSHVVASGKDMKALTALGVDAWGALAEATGMSMSQVEDAVKKGAISSQTVIKAVTDDIGGRYKGAAELSTNTWKGAMFQLSQQAEGFQQAIGTALIDTLNQFAPLIKGIGEDIKQLTDWWKGLNPNAQFFIEVVAGAIAIVPGLVTGIAAAGAALGALTTALGVTGLAFGGIIVGVTAAVVALALIGKWVYDEWPAIKAVFLVLWDDLTKKWTEVWNWVSAKWALLWDGIKGYVEPVINFITGLVNGALNLISGFMKGVGTVISALSSTSGVLKQVSDAWNGAQVAMKKAADEQAAQTKTIKDNASAQTELLKKRKEADAVELAHANQLKASQEAQKKANDEAKKAAEEALKYNESLNRAYELLAGTAPVVAAQFADMYGGIKSKATDAATFVGAAWKDLDSQTRAAIQSALDLQAAYKTLGVTSEETLAAGLHKAGEAYNELKASGTQSAADLSAAMDSLVKKQQAIVDFQTADAKRAYTEGTISATEYYEAVISNAQKALTATQDAYNAGLATAAQVAAAEKVLSDDKKAKVVQDVKDFEDAIHAMGEKSQQDLDAAINKWGDYAAVIAKTLGTESPQYLKAVIKQVEALRDAAENMGDFEGVKRYDAELVQLNARLVALTPAQKLFNDAVAALHAPDFAKMRGDLLNLGAALDLARRNADGTADSERTLQAAQDALNKAVADYIAKINGPLRDALNNGKITAQQYRDQVKKGADDVAAGFADIAAKATASGQSAVAAKNVTNSALKETADIGIANLKAAYDSLGVTQKQTFDKAVTDAKAAYAQISADANASWVQKNEALLGLEKANVDKIVAEGGRIPEGQKNDIARLQQQLTDHLTQSGAQWAAAYDGVKNSVGGAFDAIVDKLVTGKGSFKEILTSLWQGIAQSMLDAFITPVKTAIENFVATTLADLLTGKGGLNEIGSKLSEIGSSISKLFGGGSKTPGVPEVPEIPGVGGGGGGAPGGGAASGIASGLTGWIGAIGSAVTAISSVIGNFQQAHQETSLNAIEHNTRYTMMFVGERSDGGILGQAFKTNELLGWGPTAKATASMQQTMEDYARDSIGIFGEINSNTFWTMQKVDASLGRLDALLDLGGMAAQKFDVIAANMDRQRAQPVEISVNVTATGVTTKDAATALGDQIALNLSQQLAGVLLR